MFLKPFRIKSSNTVKSTDRKKLRADCVTKFPNLSPSDLDGLIPLKAHVQVHKIVTHSTLTMRVYTLERVPVLFTDDTGALYPTVFAMWRYPRMLSCIVMHGGVIEFAKRGSDVMNPGIITKALKYMIPFFSENETISLSSFGEGSSVMIGFTLRTSLQVRLEDKGHAIRTMHVIGDHLCTMDKVDEKPDTPCLTIPIYRPLPDLISSDGLIISSPTTEEDLSSESEAIETNECDELDRDFLFEQCFLGAAKLSIKKGDLPLLVSSLKTHLLKYCPPGMTLDIKKTKYKKMSNLMKEMKSNGVIEFTNHNGVDSITAIYKNCSYFRNFEALHEPEPAEEEDSADPNTLTITEFYTLKKKAVPVFQEVLDANTSVRSKFDSKRVSEVIREYVTSVSGNKMLYGNVTLDAKLTDALQCGGVLPQSVQRLDSVVSSFIENGMCKCHVIRSGENREKNVNGNPRTIDLAIVIRSGNKKVTTIKNLDQYFISAADVASSVKLACSCSTSVLQCDGKTDRCYVTAQGNQIKYISKLLIEDYNVPHRFITGMEKKLKK